MNNKELYTLQDLSKKYSISYSRLTKATMNREFPFYKQGKIFVKETDFTAWLTQERIPSVTELSEQSKIPA